MDEQERIKVHDALDRILDFAKELANQDDRHVRWKLTIEAIYSLNTILGGAEPVLRELWKGVPENTEAASATRWPVIHVLTKFQPLLPPEVWQKFVLDLIGLEDGQRSEIFEPKRPLKRKGWVARSNFSQSMGSLVLWWAETMEAGGKPIGINNAVEHACLVLGVNDRRTPYRWMATIEEDTKTAIKIAAERWRGGVRDCDALGVGPGHAFAIIGPALGQDEEAVKFLYKILSFGATGKIEPIRKLRRASPSSSPA